MRIATWNLAGRWSPHHEALMHEVGADLWLLTEVHHRTNVDGFVSYPSAVDMAFQRYWAAVLSNREGTDPYEPHSASSAVTIDGTTYCSTVLPWRTSGSQPWGTATPHSEPLVRSTPSPRVSQVARWCGEVTGTMPCSGPSTPAALVGAPPSSARCTICSCRHRPLA